MNNVQCVFSISTLALVLASGAALADPIVTRDQARAELVAAHQAGKLPAGEPEIAPRNSFLRTYPQASSTASAKTRAQVRAELIAARRDGELPVGEPEIAPRDAFPWLYSSDKTSVSTLTRAQVQAQARAAAQAGTMRASFLARSERELFPGEFAQGEASRTLAHTAASSHAN